MNLWKRIIKLLGDLGWGNILKITIILLFLCVVATLVIIMFIPDSPVESAIYDFLEWLDDIPGTIKFKAFLYAYPFMYSYYIQSSMAH